MPDSTEDQRKDPYFDLDRRTSVLKLLRRSLVNRVSLICELPSKDKNLLTVGIMTDAAGNRSVVDPGPPADDEEQVI